MNCKQGDMAIIVKSFAENEGKVVRCVEFVGPVKGRNFSLPSWRLDREFKTDQGTFIDTCPDAWLRPIRPGEGDDETLSWAGKPEKVAA